MLNNKKILITFIVLVFSAFFFTEVLDIVMTFLAFLFLTEVPLFLRLLFQTIVLFFIINRLKLHILKENKMDRIELDKNFKIAENLISFCQDLVIDDQLSPYYKKMVKHKKGLMIYQKIFLRIRRLLNQEKLSKNNSIKINKELENAIKQLIIIKKLMLNTFNDYDNQKMENEQKREDSQNNQKETYQSNREETIYGFVDKDLLNALGFLNLRYDDINNMSLKDFKNNVSKPLINKYHPDNHIDTQQEQSTKKFQTIYPKIKIIEKYLKNKK